MTKNYRTPEVIHIQEADCDGNISTIRYYRESLIERFVKTCFVELGNMRREADRMPTQEDEIQICTNSEMPGQ